MAQLRAKTMNDYKGRVVLAKTRPGSEAAGPNMTNTTGTGNNNVYIGQDAAGSAERPHG